MWGKGRWQQDGGWSNPTVAAVAFQGVGDIVGGANAYFGMRAYNAAYATGSNPSVDLVDQSGANPITINILANGFIDITSINSWVTAHSVTTIKVKRVYDQTGNGRHVNQATVANMPTLTMSAISGIPALTFNSVAGTWMDGTTTIAASSPCTISGVFKRTGSFTIASFFAGDAAITAGIGFGASANTSMANFGTVQTQAATDNVWHAIQGVGSATVGALNTDGTDTGNINTGTNNIPNSARIGASGAGIFVDGLMTEAVMYSSGLNATQRGNLNTNQHGLSGFNF